MNTVPGILILGLIAALFWLLTWLAFHMANDPRAWRKYWEHWLGVDYDRVIVDAWRFERHQRFLATMNAVLTGTIALGFTVAACVNVSNYQSLSQRLATEAVRAEQAANRFRMDHEASQRVENQRHEEFMRKVFRKSADDAAGLFVEPPRSSSPTHSVRTKHPGDT